MRMTPRCRIAICIDDVGEHAGVHAAALALLAQGRVSALSGMVHAPAWRDAAPALRDAATAADVGLHLDLTEPWGTRRFQRPWHRLVVEAFARALDAAALRSEIAAQLDAFEQAVGHAPHFVDGHRHVHQLPQVRALLLDELARRYPSEPPWVRRTVPRRPLAPGLKPLIVAALGAPGLDALLRTHGLRHNERLLGVYGFDADPHRYLHRLTRWLALAQDGDLLVCHPSTVIEPDAPLAGARAVEHQVLSHPDFGHTLEAAGVVVARMSVLRPRAGP
jgi:predicted glycoside hydrolase/deacetylase ChbG (UPF0249 family)